VILGPAELSRFATGETLGELASALLASQKLAWEQLRRGYESLAGVRTRAFAFEKTVVKVQFNPGRITSTAAKVDARSISERPCFLCMKNLPADQRGLLVHDDYLILGNPFPIFPEHFTIAHREHRPQRILPALRVFLELAREMAPRYTLVYNGPRCGASAPDHLHLQAGLRHFMPLESELDPARRAGEDLLAERNGVRITTLPGMLRTFLLLESERRGPLEGEFERVVEAYRRVAGDGEEEPMMNLLCWHENGRWVLALFARAKHRPSFFFAEGEERFLLSPAAVDMGGVCTLPLERDFVAITREHLLRMLEEVSLPPAKFELLQSAIRSGG
jgi:hypothetical protein